ncbi:survival protein sure-like phosphatase/nucleotidase [Elsinoe ampelina]|uniref:Survival protein sure-like phosphatase/nucleotidase n=1 Tax=Elsinoe ampelina TaxID=302913 RepID=A0A6A6GKS4_9PEZI|nr:survival protein sure-like phosphatase/nucleotidase [Elsinoe ampelina]
MHILVTNDDGPPSPDSSPYLLPFIRHLESSGHLVSVCIPSTQRSWIAKAHIVGQDVIALPFLPSPFSIPSIAPTATQSGTPSRPWFTLNSTPASCAQVGLHHLFDPATSGLPKIDLVVSGPNYGRNTTACFALSSGTLGAALEAAVTGYRAVAVSFAFTDRENRAEDVEAACRIGVKVVEYLAEKGEGNPGGVVFSVNVPVRQDVEGREVRWTQMLQNGWGSSCFEEHRAEEGGRVEEEGPGEVEREIREGEVGGEEKGSGGVEKEVVTGKGERHFKWSPKFTDVYESVRRAGEGSDGWAVSEGHTSVTMLRANFMHVDGGKGLIKL